MGCGLSKAHKKEITLVENIIKCRKEFHNNMNALIELHNNSLPEWKTTETNASKSWRYQLQTIRDYMYAQYKQAEQNYQELCSKQSIHKINTYRIIRQNIDSMKVDLDFVTNNFVLGSKT